MSRSKCLPNTSSLSPPAWQFCVDACCKAHDKCCELPNEGGESNPLKNCNQELLECNQKCEGHDWCLTDAGEATNTCSYSTFTTGYPNNCAAAVSWFFASRADYCCGSPCK